MEKGFAIFPGSPSMSPAATELDNFLAQKLLEMKERYSTKEIAEAAASLAMRMILGGVWGSSPGPLS